MSTLLALHPHDFTAHQYLLHLFFDGIADAGGWYASRFCTHLWHRVVVAISFALVTTLCLVTLVG